MDTTACIRAIHDAAGNALSDDEVLEIAEAIARKRARLSAEGRLDRMDEEMAELARREGEKARVAAAVARRNAAINAVVRDRRKQGLSAVAGGSGPRRQAVPITEATRW